MKKYNSYKESGYELIGEISSTWTVKRLAYNGTFHKGSGVSRADLTEEGVPVLLYGDIYTKYNIKTDSIIRKTSKEIAEKSVQIYRGDLLFTASGETKIDIGKCVVYIGNDEAYASGDVIIYRQNKFDSTYLSYLFNSYYLNIAKACLSRGEIVVHIYESQLRSIHFACPPLNEQIQIAKYLDYKINQIETLIDNKQKLIELIKEERTVIINQAVTKGINPKVKFKSSGITWLGEIPEHWEVKSLKYLINKKIDNRGKTPPFGDEGRPMLEVKQIENDKMFPSTSFEKFVSPEVLKDYVRDEVCEGDVLIATVGATAGKCCLVPKDSDFFIAQNVIGFRCKKNIYNLFFYYMIESSYFKDSLFSINKSNTIDNLKVSVFVNNKCVVPTYDEQKIIANFIENALNKSVKLEQKIIQEIELLKEYKTALISEVVTGKVDVRDEVIK